MVLPSRDVTVSSNLKPQDADDMNEWRKVFFDKTIKLINPSDERIESIQQNNDPVQFYSLTISNIEGINKRLEESEKGCSIQVQMSFLDMTYKQFFGRTWVGPPKKLPKDNLGYNETVFFCTPIRDEHVLIVIEIVAKLKNNSLKSCGWTVYRPFNKANMNNFSAQRIGMYIGTPRALLFMDEPFEKSKNLIEITGAYINFTFSLKTKLAAVKNFIPENVILGRNDRIGGILDDNSRNPLESPKLAQQFAVIIDDLYIYLNPNVTKFESEFARLIAEDKSQWDKIKIEPSMISISERRLKIGVHNGWRYIHDPYIVHLSLDDPSNQAASQFSTKRSIRLNMKSSMKQRASEPDASNQNVNRLVMRNSIVLNEVIDDPMCAIVFQIEYVINVPIQINLLSTTKNNKTSVTDSKSQLETHHIIVRWGAFCPFADSNQLDGRVEINMFGAGVETYNPEQKLVFMRPQTDLQDQFSSRSAPGKITFDIRKGNNINVRHHEEYDNSFGVGMSEQNESRRPKSQEITMLNETQQKSIYDIYNQMMPKPDDHFQTSQANLLMSQLISRASESQRLVGLFGGNLELYPIYNPSLHMPVLALAPGQIGGRTMSRAAYAKLQSAKFPQILDRFGNMAEVIDGGSFLQFDLQKEEADNLTCNQIVIQFLAFSRTLESLRTKDEEPSPKNVFFTFQFYRFPEFKTPKLHLDKIIEDFSYDQSSTPFILKHIDKDNTSTPGYMISYSIDPTNLKLGEKKIFFQYLAHHAMFIDVWDADSLHLIGTCTLQLKELIRHGKDAVQSTHELDIISTEYDDDTRLNSANTYRDGGAYSSDSHIKLKGLLHIRVGNVGSPIEDRNDPIKQTSLAPTIPLNRVIASKNSLNAYGESLLARKIDETATSGFISHNVSKAHHMAETFKDIHAALVAKNNKNISDTTDLDPLRKRKLNRMEIVRKMQQNENIPPQLLGNHRRIIEDRNKDLKIMEFYRNQTKHDQIMNKLHEFITTEYSIYPNFGIVEFFEFVITNPYNEAQTITIISDDPDVQIVTDAKEWRHLKLLHQIYSQVEDNMFHRQEIDPNHKDIKYPQIYLRPKETINIPLKYQTFKADHKIENSNEYLKYNDDHYVKNVPPKFELKKINVFFRAEDRNPIAILRLLVDQQPHVVNQTFRFQECEHSFLKRTIRLPSSARALAANSTALLSGDIKLDGTVADQASSQLYVRSSDPNVVLESKPVTIGEPHDIFIKAATGASPNVKKFYIAIYADQYLAVPLQIWQIYLHSLNRIDVSCSQGQTSRFSLILKGTQSSRVVKCYSNIPEEMSIVPADKFMLASNAVQELNVGVQPRRSGIKHYYINVVDVEMSALVQSWFININCKPPVISKAFELTLPVSTGTTSASMTSQKRVSYTNPYSTERIFLLSTNRDDLLIFKERRIKFMANETKTLALKFLPNPLTGFAEIFVFINNESDTNEETFALRVTYVKVSAIN